MRQFTYSPSTPTRSGSATAIASCELGSKGYADGAEEDFRLVLACIIRFLTLLAGAASDDDVTRGIELMK